MADQTAIAATALDIRQEAIHAMVVSKGRETRSPTKDPPICATRLLTLGLRTDLLRRMTTASPTSRPFDLSARPILTIARPSASTATNASVGRFVCRLIMVMVTKCDISIGQYPISVELPFTSNTVPFAFA